MENNFHIASAAVSDIGLNEKRPQNEDSYLELDQRNVFAVADGVGGAQAGDVASQMAMEILSEAFVNFADGGDPEDLMKRAIEQANTAIFQMSHDLPQLSSMATTVVALHISGNIATIGHVGDSRMYRLDGNGSLFRETQDHSIVEEEVRAGRMTADQAATHPSRNVISRALGAEQTVEIDMKTIMFEPDTAFLLCSDGITRHINDFEIRELLALDTGPNDICDRMKRICYERGAEDNLTAVVVKVSAENVRQFNGQETSSLLDLDEPTIATARPATEDQDVLDTPENGADNYETKPLEMPGDVAESFAQDDEETIEPVAEAGPAIETAASTAETAAAARASASDANFNMFASSQPTESAPKKGNGAISRILSGLIMLLLGALAGVAVYSYLVPKPAPEPAPVLETKPVDVNLRTFEETRRIVDTDPAKYIAMSTASPPHDAEDYYLLGRAYLFTGEYVKSRAAFVEAKNRVQEMKEVNRKPILNDIAMGLSIIDNTFSQKGFADNLSKNALTSEGNVNGNGKSNTKMNSAPNSNVNK